MARKLKTFTTSGGFFDLAVAAPSMKAALEAWGAESNLFHQGFAKQTEDEEIIAATMAKPGLVLRRPVGTNAAFSEHAELPTHLGAGVITRAPPMPRTTPAKPPSPVDDRTDRAAAAAFDREQKRRARQALREEAAQKKELAGDIKASWGDQMRSYVLQPYQMVKDLRTEHESGNPSAVFDGDIDAFIDAGIRWRRAQ